MCHLLLCCVIVKSGLNYLFTGCLGTRGHQDHAAVLAGLEKSVSCSHANFHLCVCMYDPCFSCEFLFNFLGTNFYFENYFLSRCVSIVRAVPFCEFDFWKATLQVVSSSREVVGAGPGDKKTSH